MTRFAPHRPPPEPARIHFSTRDDLPPEPAIATGTMGAWERCTLAVGWSLLISHCHERPMSVDTKNVAVFGSTGSIGRNALEVIAASSGRLNAVALSAYGKLDLLL